MSYLSPSCRSSYVLRSSAIAAAIALLTGSMAAQQLRKLSVGVNGEDSNGDSYGATQSANGRYVVSCSSATNLVSAPDANGAELDLYRHDNSTAINERISLSTDGQQLRIDFCAASISSDGRFVSFWAAERWSPFRSGIFLRDIAAATTQLVAQTPNPESYMTADGTLIGFSQGEQEGPWSVFIHNVAQGVTDGPVADGYLKDMSSDGRYLLLTSDGSSFSQLFWLDRTTAVTRQIGPGDARNQAAMSATGRFVLFNGQGAAGEFPWRLYDATADTSELISTHGSSDSWAYSRPITPDGRFVAFQGSTAPASEPENSHLFIRDRVLNLTTDLTPSSTADNPTGASISADGRYVAFNAPCAPTGGLCTPGFYHVYLVDRGTEAVGSLVVAGGTVTSDPEGDGATTFDSIEVSVTTSTEGLVTLEELPAATSAPQGFSLLGREFVVSAPMGTTELPLVLVFRADSSIAPNGATALVVLRNGIVVDPCLGSSAAFPDPCLSDTQVLADGDVQLTVRTSSASRWNLAVRQPYPFEGFYQPVENAPTLNSVKTGSAVPVKFSLGGDRGLNVFAAGFPLSHQVQCDTGAPIDAIEETVNAGGSSLSYDAETGQYTYVWKTDKAWGGSCRELQIKLTDGEVYTARFTLRK